jgi:hypothetical protein
MKICYLIFECQMSNRNPFRDGNLRNKRFPWLPIQNPSSVGAGQKVKVSAGIKWYTTNRNNCTRLSAICKCFNWTDFSGISEVYNNNRLNSNAL